MCVCVCVCVRAVTNSTRGCVAIHASCTQHHGPTTTPRHANNRKFHQRGYGATVARLTPDQKVGSSNLSALIHCAAGGRTPPCLPTYDVTDCRAENGDFLCRPGDHRFTKNCLHFSICACQTCEGAILIFSVSFHFYRMIPEGNPTNSFEQIVYTSRFVRVILAQGPC